MPQGGYLCFLDTSPKLPSSLLANHVSDRVKALSGPDQTLNVLLIREKVSKLSEKVTLDGSLQLILGNNGTAASTDRTLKPIDISQVKTKVIELRNQMDPASLAE